MKFSPPTLLPFFLVGIGLVGLAISSHERPKDEHDPDSIRFNEWDRPFFARFNSYIQSLSDPSTRPDIAAAGWADLVVHWKDTSRVLLFHDLLKVLPPPTSWPVLEQDFNQPSKEFAPDKQAILQVMSALLNRDHRAEMKSFDRLLGQLLNQRRSLAGPELNQLLKLFEYLTKAENDPAESRAQLDRLLRLIELMGPTPTHPLLQLYIPDLSRLGDAPTSAAYAEKLLLVPTQLFSATENEETRQLLRDETALHITQMSCLPDAWYHNEGFWSGFAGVAQRFLDSHADTMSDQCLSVILLNRLKSGRSIDPGIEEGYIERAQQRLGQPEDRSVRAVFKAGLAAPALDFMAEVLQKTPEEWVAVRCALFAQMSARDADFDRLIRSVGDRPDFIDTLSAFHLRRGNYDVAKKELLGNLDRISRASSFQLGLFESRRAEIAAQEVASLLSTGLLLHRPDWLAEGRIRVLPEARAILNNSGLLPEERQGYFALLVQACLDAKLDEEAKDCFKLLLPLGTKFKLNDTLRTQKMQVAVRAQNWPEILAMIHDDPNWWTRLQSSDGATVDSNSFAIEPRLAAVEAYWATGHHEAAISLLRKRCETGTPTPSLLKVSVEMLGMQTTLDLMEHSPDSGQAVRWAERILGGNKASRPVEVISPTTFSDLDPSEVELRIEAMSSLHDTALKGNDLASADDYAVAIQSWKRLAEALKLFKAHLDCEALNQFEQAVPLLKSSSLLNFYLAMQLERNGRDDEAGIYYTMAFDLLGAPVGSEFTAGDGDSWLERIPFLTPLAQKKWLEVAAGKVTPTLTTSVDCLVGLMEEQNGHFAAAVASFSRVIEADPNNRMANDHLLDLCDKVPLSPRVPQAAMESLLRQYRLVGSEPLREFDLAALWQASVAGPTRKPFDRDEQDWSRWAYHLDSFNSSRKNSTKSIDPAFYQALQTLAQGQYPAAMAGVADTEGLALCGELMDEP